MLVVPILMGVITVCVTMATLVMDYRVQVMMTLCFEAKGVRKSIVNIMRERERERDLF